jgi:hypothetical protein
MRPRSAIKGFPCSENRLVDILNPGFRIVSYDDSVSRALPFKSFTGSRRDFLAIDP